MRTLEASQKEKYHRRGFSKNPGKKSVKKHLESPTETERGENLDKGRCLSRHCTVTDTALLETGSVQKRGNRAMP